MEEGGGKAAAAAGVIAGGLEEAEDWQSAGAGGHQERRDMTVWLSYLFLYFISFIEVRLSISITLQLFIIESLITLRAQLNMLLSTKLSA